ncbi:hypothetical protein K1719_025658 [Acacia pycnantha]|nr:hypothetical protein K1719_025658 [Acacia pycnantha]
MLWRRGVGSISMMLLSLLASPIVSGAETVLRSNATAPSLLNRAFTFLWQSGDESSDSLVWPEMELGWRMVVGTIIGFFGAAFGSIGGIGGGGFFVPMLRLVIGFDPKSATALSKCMIMGATVSTVFYNLRLKHPTLDLPIIDYDLALLIQPMLMLGISIGVVFNVVFADWMETLLKQEAAKRQESNDASGAEVQYRALPSGPNDAVRQKGTIQANVNILENIYWKELGLLVFVWVAFLALQIAKNHTANCSAAYWILSLLQIPVAVGASMYEAVSLYKGRRRIASKGDEVTRFRVLQLVFYCFLGLMAGIVGGLLGVGGGSIMGPLFLELGVPPQVSSATATFAMTFSSSMSVVEYYLLQQFPVPYALYLVAVATIAAYIGQHVMRKVLILFGRASLIIFILASVIIVSAVTLGGVGIANMVEKIENNEYMGFENLCSY